jgi:hypothetical protein
MAEIDFTPVALIKLRPPDEVVRVEETFADARRHVDALAGREIGGLCIKGVAGGPDNGWQHGNNRLWNFMTELAWATKGSDVSAIDLYQRQHRSATGDDVVPVVFTDDIELHFDGLSEFETDPETGELVPYERYPLYDPRLYRGVGHHITEAGRVVMVMDKLDTDELIYEEDYGMAGTIEETRPFTNPPSGEAVVLEADDYLAFHNFCVNGEQNYAHAALYPSPDRRSVLYSPYEVPSLRRAVTSLALRDLVEAQIID